MKEYSMVGTIICLVLLAIVIATTYSSIRNNTQYYQMSHECIVSGGSFIPTPSNNGGNAICIAPNVNRKSN